MRLSAAAVGRVLREWPIARLATVTPAGQPHQVPIVFARSGEALYSPIDGKPKGRRELARIRNVLHEPRVSLLLDDYSEDWSRLWWLRIDGDARVLRPEHPESAPEVAAALAALREKYPQYATTPILTDRPTLIAIAIREERSWCAGPHAVP